MVSDYQKMRSDEVIEYRESGKYPRRITTDINGNEYVVGDWSWNIQNPNSEEYIEKDSIIGRHKRTNDYTRGYDAGYHAGIRKKHEIG